jgi:hypothetical protein
MKKILFTLAIVASTALSYGQGTITFGNGATSRFTLDGVNVAIGAPITFGVWYGTSAGNLSMAPVLGSVTTTAGIIAPASGTSAGYQLAGTSPNQTGIFLQFRAWSSSFGANEAGANAAEAAYSSQAGVVYGETAIVQIGALGASTGPGTAIWQGSAGVLTDRLNAFVLTTSAIPEPSTYALGALGIGALLMVRRRKV